MIEIKSNRRKEAIAITFIYLGIAEPSSLPTDRYFRGVIRSTISNYFAVGFSSFKGKFKIGLGYEVLLPVLFQLLCHRGSDVLD